MKLIALCLCLSLPACASDAVRPTAAATMNMTQGLRTEMLAFAARQNREIDEGHRNMALERQEAQVSAFRGAKQRMDWRSAKSEEALRLFDEATKPGSGPGLAGLISVPPGNSAASAVKPDAKQYDALLKALKPLASKGSVLNDAKFLIGLTQQVVDQMNNDVKAAADAGGPAPAAGGNAGPGN